MFKRVKRFFADIAEERKCFIEWKLGVYVRYCRRTLGHKRFVEALQNIESRMYENEEG